jgi:L-threonylcarbamoyladenylate synthase
LFRHLFLVLVVVINGKIATFAIRRIENPNNKIDMDEAIRQDVKKACEVMQKGGVILYPTDTIWGIGCDATNAEAVKRVYDIKRRADSKAMLVLVDSSVKVDFYVRDVPAVAWDLIDYATKPLTIIYDGARNLAENLLAEDGSVGIRVTSEEFSKELCFRFRKAIVSTSANISGQPSPANFSEISEEVKQAVDYIVGYRQDEVGHPKPSSIIKLGKGGEVKIIRE